MKLKKMNKFNKAYAEIESLIKSDSSLFKEVKTIALLGSVSDGEESNEWSDLDVLLILKSNDLGTLDLNALDKLKKIISDLSKKYDFPISLLPHTVDEFENYVCFEYLKHYSDGKVTYPKSDSLKQIINEILERRNVNERERKSYCLYHLRHVRFNYLRKMASINENNSSRPNKEICMLLIDKMIKVTDLALNYFDQWPMRKNDVLAQAKETLDISVEPLENALSVRKRWAEVTEEESKEFIKTGTDYLIETVEYILNKEGNRSTPEENMPKP